MIEDFSGTGRQPGIARPTWKASETLRGSKRVHFTGITGFQSRECQSMDWDTSTVRSVSFGFDWNEVDSDSDE